MQEVTINTAFMKDDEGQDFVRITSTVPMQLIMESTGHTEFRPPSGQHDVQRFKYRTSKLKMILLI